jgi:hypothetical protein
MPKAIQILSEYPSLKKGSRLPNINWSLSMQHCQRQSSVIPTLAHTKSQDQKIMKLERFLSLYLQ